MLTYKAMYKFLESGVHAEVLDFPGVITCGATQEEARRLLASALVDMAETHLLHGEALPIPDPQATDPESDLNGGSRAPKSLMTNHLPLSLIELLRRCSRWSVLGVEYWSGKKASSA